MVLLVAGCQQASGTAEGIVIDVKSASVTQVDTFTLRTAEGRELLFRIGPLELDGDAFPAGHLREHMALGEPIRVAFRDENGSSVAYRLTDASPSSQPS